MNIALGVDHAAFPYKEEMITVIRSLGHEIIDCGTHDCTPVDYPSVARAVALAVREGQAEAGVFLCGTGIGGSIVANKIPGIRAALCHESYTAALSRQHNDANVLCIGARVVGINLAGEIVRVWLTTPWSGEARHARRLRMIEEME